MSRARTILAGALKVRWAKAPHLRKFHPEAQVEVLMTPTEFLGKAHYAPSLISRKSVERLKDEIERGKEIEPVFLDIDIDTGKILNHEGRHRAIALKELGIRELPVIQYMKRKGEFVKVK